MLIAVMAGGPLHGQTRVFAEDGMPPLSIKAAREFSQPVVFESVDPIAPAPPPPHWYELRWYSGRPPWQGGKGPLQRLAVYLCMDEPPRQQFPWHDDERIYYLCMADGLWRAAVEAALPPCVVPDCGEKGRLTFVAAESGRLAGREWRRGDEIRLCPRHGYDVARAAGARGMDQLPDWLKGDATWGSVGRI